MLIKMRCRSPGFVLANLAMMGDYSESCVMSSTKSVDPWVTEFKFFIRNAKLSLKLLNRFLNSSLIYNQPVCDKYLLL